jgi:hypothetical protein
VIWRTRPGPQCPDSARCARMSLAVAEQPGPTTQTCAAAAPWRAVTMIVAGLWSNLATSTSRTVRPAAMRLTQPLSVCGGIIAGLLGVAAGTAELN